MISVSNADWASCPHRSDEFCMRESATTINKNGLFCKILPMRL